MLTKKDVIAGALMDLNSEQEERFRIETRGILREIGEHQNHIKGHENSICTLQAKLKDIKLEPLDIQTGLGEE